MKQLINILVAIFFSSISVYGNDTLYAGKPIPYGNSIKTESQMYYSYSEMPDGKCRAVSLYTTTVQLLEFNNEKVWAYIQKNQSERGVNIDTTFFKQTSLVPVAYRTDIGSAGYKEKVDFSGDKIVTTIVYADSVTTNSRMTVLNYFHAPMQNFIIGRLPLKEGFSITLREVNAGKNYIEIYPTITVTGSEKLSMPDGRMLNCWKVQYTNRANVTTMWFSKDTHRFIKSRSGDAVAGYFCKTALY